MLILGISAFYHDSAAALIEDGVVIIAIQEERLSRVKNDSSFPRLSIEYILEKEGLSLKNIDAIVYYDKPWVKFERIIESIVCFAPKSLSSFLSAMPSWLGSKLNFRNLLLKEFKSIDKTIKKLPPKFSTHHFSHAAASFYTSPFKDACVLSIDGVGEKSTLSIYDFDDRKYRLLKEMYFPHSIGILYSAFTFFCGFKINSGEYKLMGLAPYGKENKESQKYQEIIEEKMVKIFDDGSIYLNLEFFEFHRGRKTINTKVWESAFGLTIRSDSEELSESYMNFAFAAQRVIEKIIVRLVRTAKSLTKSKNLCLSGGVALNCVANAKVYEEKAFDSIWIHPAPGDAGGAVGAALGYYYHHYKYQPRSFTPYLGPDFSMSEIESALKKYKLNYCKLDFQELIEVTAKSLVSEKIIGWFQGKMEWGPRALGNRSILASATPKDMQKKLNLKIKYREDFRPFAPVCIEEKVKNYFSKPLINPYMQYVHKSLRPEIIPSVTHKDGTSRLQTVNARENAKLYKLLVEYEKHSGIPVLINTSFNVRGEPIVCSPKDAIECFLSTEMDILAIENFIIKKADNLIISKKFIRKKFSKD